MLSNLVLALIDNQSEVEGRKREFFEAALLKGVESRHKIRWVPYTKTKKKTKYLDLDLATLGIIFDVGSGMEKPNLVLCM